MIEIPGPRTCLSKQVATSLTDLIYLGQGGKWHLYLRAINKANEGGRRIWRGRQVAGKGARVKGIKITRVPFSSLNTIQHVIVKMALVAGNSVLREKGYIIFDKKRKWGLRCKSP